MKLVYKETFKSLILIFSIIVLSTLLINLLYYFDIISNNLVKYCKMIFLVIAFFVGGVYMGKNSPNKGYLYGLRLSLIIILVFVVFGIVFNNLSFARIIYYIITIVCITFGSMVGINRKSN